MELSEHEIGGLLWMRDCNKRRIGFLGPTVRKEGPLADYDRLERLGYARCVSYATGEKRGYWLTADGKRALEEYEKARNSR